MLVVFKCSFPLINHNFSDLILVHMGAITLNEYINSGALDDFKILAVKAYDKPAA